MPLYPWLVSPLICLFTLGDSGYQADEEEIIVHYINIGVAKPNTPYALVSVSTNLPFHLR